MVPSARNEVIRLLRFRRAMRPDVGGIVSLTNEAYRGESFGGWTTEAHLVGVQRTDAEVVEEVLATSESMIVLAEIGSSLAGCVQLMKQGSYVVLGMLAVRPELQGRGIGGLIIREAERICRDELRVEEIRMHVLYMRSDIIAWYERLGYKPNGERVPFPYGDERVGVPKRADLEFAVLMKVLE